ncbi:hypothetical protein DRO19_05070 [Candidatus Bathyarchaeota archaeon]|nr:MAG: hypothetical protein DRO19_05070 [Candidatus Bathyarchaeota archaeon]
MNWMEEVNKPLKKPRYYKRSLTLFRSVDNLLAHADRFIPAWDDTDHFSFACAKCGYMAEILSVEWRPDYKENGRLYAILFFLKCPNCGATGMRKIYLQPTSYMGQKAFGEKLFFLYGTEKRPFQIGKYTIQGLRDYDEKFTEAKQ